METESGAPNSKAKLWTGWILTVIPVGMLVFSAAMKLMKHPAAVEGFAKYGYPESALVYIGIAELACAVLYAIPRTAVFGAILVAAYLGGATNHHVRAGEPYWAAVLLGVMAWAGLYLREPRLQALVPFRK